MKTACVDLKESSDSDPSESSHNYAEEHEIAEPEQEDILAAKETKDVLRIKLVVLLVLVVSAIGVGASVYWYTKRTEENTFSRSLTGLEKKERKKDGCSHE